MGRLCNPAEDGAADFNQLAYKINLVLLLILMYLCVHYL
jgi:hypothetical protein